RAPRLRQDPAARLCLRPAPPLRHPRPLGTNPARLGEPGMDPEDRHQVEGALLSETGGTATRVAAVLAAYNRRDLNLAWRPFKTVLVEPGDAPGPATPWLSP